MSSKKSKLLVPILLVLLAAPMLYLFIKTKGAPALTQEEVPLAQNSVASILSLEDAVKTNPTFDNLVNLSMAYTNNNMPGKSIEHLKRAIEINPAGAVAYNNLGVAYTLLMQFQNGIDACTKAIELDSTFQLAKNNLNWATDERNKVLATIQEQENSPSDKRDVAFGIEYGLNYFKVGNYTKSIEIWNYYAEKDLKNTSLLNNIGTAFMMKNQVDDAMAIFKRVLTIEPDNQLAKNNLTWALAEKEKEVRSK